MILLFPIVFGLAFGWLRRGRLANLAVLPLRHAWLPLVGIGLQLAFVFFSHSNPDVPSSIRVGVLLATYSGLIGFLLLNRRLPGVGFLLLGASLNAAVMTANGGYMPITPEALARSGHEGQIVEREGALFVYGSKDIVLGAEDTRLGFLSDVYGIPEELPFPATFSLGDLLIGVGATVLVSTGMSLGRGVEQGPSGAARHQAARPSRRRGQWSVVSGQGREPAQASSTVAGIPEAGNRKLEAER